MTAAQRELAAKLARIVQTETADVVRPLAQQIGTDTVASVSGDSCSLTAAGPNFRVVGGLTVVPGDLVLFTRRGTERLVVAVIGRNAIEGGGGGGSGFSNPMTGVGDLMVGGASGVATRLGVGSEDQVLTVQADGTLGWDDPATGGAVAAADVSITDTAGDFTATDVEGALAELQSDAEADAAALTAHESDTTSVHGITDTTQLYRAGGTDVAVADGGTGASDASGARTNLGLVIGTDVEAHDSDLTAIAALSPTNDDLLQRKAGAWTNRTPAQLLTDLGLGSIYQPLDSDLTAIAALTTTSYGRAFLALANQAALMALLSASSESAQGIIELATQTETNTGTDDARAVTPLKMQTRLAAYAQPLDSDLTAIAALSTTSYGRSLLEAADAAALRTLGGLVIGTNVQAYDAELAALAGLTSAADKSPYFTGSGTAALATLTSYARTLLDDGDAATARATLGLVIGTNVQAQDAELAALAGLTSAADKFPYFTGSGTASLLTIVSAIRTLLAAADVSAFRTAAGLAIGSDVQAYDAELAAIAGLTSAADKLPYFTGSGTASLATLTSFMRTVLDDTDAATALATLGAIAKSILTAKGQLIGASASGTPGVLTVGSDGEVLTADAASTLGVKWAAVSGGGLTDGDKGDITVSGTGTVLTVDSDAITYAKMQNVSATDKLLGRATAGAGDVEEIALTAAGRALIDDADASAQRTTLGLVIGTDVEAHDADLTTIAGLSPTNDDVLQRKAGAWANRSPAQLLADLAAVGTTFQPLDSDLTAIAALTTTSFGRSLLAAADAAALRTLGGLGSIATQAASSVAITGGSVAGITDLAVADGGTGASAGGIAGALGGLGMQVVSVSSGAIGGTSSGEATVTWPVAFANTNYTALVIVENPDTTARQPPTVMLRTNGTNKTASAVVVRVFNPTAVSQTYTLRVIGIPD